jgi:hypothetical protein
MASRRLARNLEGVGDVRHSPLISTAARAAPSASTSRPSSRPSSR